MGYGRINYGYDSKTEILTGDIDYFLQDKYYFFPTTENYLTILSEEGVSNLINSFEIPVEQGSPQRTILCSALIPIEKINDKKIILPANLAKSYKVNKIGILIGMGTRIEVWNAKMFNNMCIAVSAQAKIEEEARERGKMPIGFGNNDAWKKRGQEKN